MSNKDQIAFYRDRVERYGRNAQGVGWNSRRTQRRRFGVIESALGSLSGLRLVDAGCGWGDLLLFLRERKNEPARYLGLELMPEMVQEARRLRGREIRECDVLCDRLPEADWYVSSGAMNRLSPVETRIFIRRCWEASRRGFVFNLLEGEGTIEGFGRYRVGEIVEYCRSLGAKVRWERGYLPEDFTVILQGGEA